MKLRTLIRAYVRREAELHEAWATWLANTRAALAAIGGYASTSPDSEGYARTFELPKDDGEGFFQGVTRMGGDDPYRRPVVYTDVGDAADAEERSLKGRPLKRVDALRRAIMRRVDISEYETATPTEIILHALKIFEKESA